MDDVSAESAKKLKTKDQAMRSIARLHGILKRKPNGKSLAEEWAGHKREEKALEET